jgi:DNA-3-methyladenine glycosylase II
MTQEQVKQAERALIKQDPALGVLIRRQKLKPLIPERDYFEALSSSIISQQISVKAAEAIFKRFKETTKLKPAIAAKLNEEQIKAIGLSQSKARYIKDLAGHFIKDPNVYNHLERQTDEQVIAELTEIKGIGKWTAQMFLIFTLARPDVFAPDDVGLQRGMLNLYGWQTLPPRQELDKLAEKWRPYRSVASLHLWHSLDNKPIE